MVKRRPEELAAASPSGVFTADHGNTVSIPCNVSRSQDGTTVVYQWYRDGERVATVAGASTGALVLGDVDQEHRGRYECVVEISVAGVGGQPLEEIIGAVTIGVGGSLVSVPNHPVVIPFHFRTTYCTIGSRCSLCYHGYKPHPHSRLDSAHFQREPAVNWVSSGGAVARQPDLSPVGTGMETPADSGRPVCSTYHSDWPGSIPAVPCTDQGHKLRLPE